MKVPHNILGRTRPTSAGMDGIRVDINADAFGAGIARGFEGLAAGLRVRETQNTQRTEKLDRFQSMSNFSDFEVKMNERMAELKRSADPTGKDFAKLAEKDYDIAADEFIANMVPEDMKMEARYWASNTRQRIVGDALNFEYEAGDAYYRAGVDKQYQRSLSALDPKLGGDPARLIAEKEATFATIDASDLSEIEKAKLKRDISVGLEGVVYKQAVKVRLNGGGGGVASFIKREEGFRTTPYWDVNAWRIGYGSDTITRADGTVVRVKPGDSVTRAEAEADLDRRINQEFVPRARGQIGEQAWGALSGNAKMALASVAYNYGSLPNSVVNAAKTGNTEALAAAVAGLSSNKDRRRREADAIRGGGDPPSESGDLDSSPLFANLPYEDRLALLRDGEAEFEADRKAQAEAERLRIDSLTNQLYNRINDGLAGQTEIEAGRAEGWLTDYDAIAKAQALYEKRNGDILLAREGQAKLESGSTFDPTSDDDRKRLNAMVGKTGLAAIDGMDQNYMYNGIIPTVTRAGDIPTDVVGLLTGMIRSNDQAKALYAYNAFAALQEADNAAFDARVPDGVAADVNFYRMQRTMLPADQLFEALNGGRTQAERQGRALLYQEAQDVLKAKKEGVAQISTMVEAVTSGFNGWTTSAQQVGVPAFAKQLTFDYEAAFVDAYIRDPDIDRANEAATKQLQKDWAVSEAGGGVLMKNPPEKAGYAPSLGSYAWITEQARSDLGLAENERYELISDDRTASEVAAAKLGGAPPTYQVVTYDEFGVPRLRMAEDGVTPKRIYFEKTPEIKQIEERKFDIDRLSQEIDEIETEIAGSLRGRVPPSLETTRQLDALKAQRKELMKDYKEIAPRWGYSKPGVAAGMTQGRAKPLGYDLFRSILDAAD